MPKAKSGQPDVNAMVEGLDWLIEDNAADVGLASNLSQARWTLIDRYGAKDTTPAAGEEA